MRDRGMCVRARPRRVQRAACTVAATLTILAVLVPLPADADCTFSDLAWEGDAVRVRVTAGAESRDALVDVATGSVRAASPRVQDPVACPARRSVLFRDVLGVFEVAADGSGEPVLRLFLPDATPRFVRAFGADAHGRLLAWTYDRASGRHELWTEGGDGGRPVREDLAGGPDALRVWRERNVTTPFDRTGERIVRTACVRFGARPERVCVEPTGRDAAGRPRFQLVLGEAGAMGEWARDTAAIGLAPAPDSSCVLVALEESIDGARCATTWLATPSQARRIATSAAPASAPARVQWSSPSGALWLDAAGALWRVDAGAGSAAPMAAAARRGEAAAFHRIVVGRVADADSAFAWVERLGAAGFEAGARRDGAAWEVQAGAMTLRAEAEARANALADRGMPARIELGGAADVAPGIAFGVVAQRGGRRAFVRNVATSTGVASQLWIQDGQAAPRLRLAAYPES